MLIAIQKYGIICKVAQISTLSKTINLLKQKYKKGMDQGQILQEPNKIKFGSIFVVSHLSFK